MSLRSAVTTGWTPPLPGSIEETGLSLAFIANLALKTLYSGQYLTGAEVARRLHLPYPNVTAPALEHLRRQQLVEVRGGRMGEPSYEYVLTEKGWSRARELMDQSGYVGPAPVTLGQYFEVMKRQSLSEERFSREDLEEHLTNLVLTPDVFDQLGPAINSRRAVFIHGSPGNGKTAVSEALGRMLRGSIWIPYVISVHGSLIVLYDPLNHEALDERHAWEVGLGEGGLNNGEGALPDDHDSRWVRIRRPFVVAGGELALRNLDLAYDDALRIHQAPYHLKANGGLFFIDDFGRQSMQPRDILNRWMVPLERRLDFLTLHTGEKIAVPFETLVVLATNLTPHELVDEAFLRRIPHKIEMIDPTEAQFRTIFQREAERLGIWCEEGVLEHLVERHYQLAGRPFRGCHPRDLLEHLLDIALYEGAAPRATPEVIDRACAAYFVELNSGAARSS